MPRVSVNIAVYNECSYIAQAIESVQQQTFLDWELIVVDDGSTDDTDQVVTQFAARDDRIRLIRQPHRGRSAAFNKAFASSKGRYIALQGASDISARDRLQKQVDFLKANPSVAVVSSRMWWFAADPRKAFLLVRYPTTAEGIEEWFLRGRMAVPHGPSMVRREVLAQVGGYDETLPRAVDFHLYLRIHKRFRMTVLPDRLYLYRRTAPYGFAKTRHIRTSHRYALASNKAGNREMGWFPEYLDTYERPLVRKCMHYVRDLASFVRARLRLAKLRVPPGESSCA